MTKEFPQPAMSVSSSADTPSDARAAAHARRVRAEAAVWVVRIDAGRATQDDARLARWRARSPLHREAFDGALAQWRGADALRAAQHAPLRAAGADQRNEQRNDQRDDQRNSEHADRRNDHRPIERPTARPRTPARFAFGFAALFTPPRTAFASLCVAFGVGAAWYLHAPDLSTSAGEVRTFALDDGSIVKLDADSAIDVRYDAHERRIVLARGRAAFDVKHGDARRFVVHAGDGEVVDIGTAFQASLPGDGTGHGGDAVVTVTQGRVDVRNAWGDLEAGAGQSVAYGDAVRPPALAAIDAYSATAWQRGRMVFTDAPLADVAAALNRYWKGHFIYVRGRAATLRVSGNFAIGAPAQALDTLAETLRLQATRIAGRVVILSASS
ncbi:FecR domain-containing protein [Paraburkholderia sp.]|uniref:FecR family protein n=1 Tax=Paraburkholderia sp. TaxID=1926495 RepID=UPI00286F3DBB|nr:FecR domain-containing protein [Paraburkholderia sp.]